jgi:non-specific serine/threonine protein kinase
VGKVGNLPLELSSFVGRRRELVEAKRLLSVSRLVTLTGVGGVGKTRLALHVAMQVRRAFGGDVWVVELGQLQDPALLANTVTAALGVREHVGRPPLTTLAEVLAQRRLLLILDNCEHLVRTVADLVERLLRACPALSVLATSRERLGVDGEVLLPVPPLAVPNLKQLRSQQRLSRYEAVALFTDRAATAAPEFALAEEDHAVVAEICDRLDGLPLAIELAASRLRTLSVQQIRHRLSDRYQLLSTGPHGRPARQQTLWACMQWSYDLCTVQEQRLWARLAVFAGGFPLEAAEAICAGGDLPAEDVLNLVASLVNKSILIPEKSGTVVRYRILEMISEFARQKLRDSGMYPALRRRHRDWYEKAVLDFEAEWISAQQPYWLSWLRTELPNLRVALEFSLTEPGEDHVALRMVAALHPCWFARGMLSEARHWLARVLATSEPRPSADRIKALYTATVLAGLQGDIDTEAVFVKESRELAEQLGDPVMTALALHAAGHGAFVTGDMPTMVRYLDQAIAVFSTHEGATLWHVEALVALGVVSGLLGDEARARASYEQVLSITQQHGELSIQAYARWALGIAAWRSGAFDRASEMLRWAIRMQRVLDDRLALAWSLDVMAWVTASQRNPQLAATLLGAVDALTRTMGTESSPFPDLRDAHDDCERQVRDALGDQAFEVASRHGASLSPEDAIALVLGEKPSPSSLRTGTAALTRREEQVAALVAEGLTNKEIAARLVISQSTAARHIEHILAKLGFLGRAQIAAWVAARSQGGRHGDIPGAAFDGSTPPD